MNTSRERVAPGPGAQRAGIAVNLYSHVFDGPAADAVRRLSDQGFSRFEVMMFPGHLWLGEPSAYRDLVRAAEGGGARLISLNMPNIDINVAGASAEMRDYSLALLGSFIEVAGELGIPRIILSPGKPNPLFPAPGDVLRDALFAALDALLPRARRSGVRLLLENVPFGVYPGAASLMQAIDDFGEAEIGVTFDVANAHFIGENPAQGLRRVVSRLALVHLSDTTRASFRHDPIGQGDVPFNSLTDVVAELGLHDRLVLEVISRDPDVDIASSADRLLELGFGRAS